VPIVTNEIDIFELRNDVPTAKLEDLPTLFAETGIWSTKTGDVAGISMTTYGDVSTLVSPTEARKLAKWLTRAADALEGANSRKSRPGSKPSHYEPDDDDTTL
jgi:hypothetical protein